MGLTHLDVLLQRRRKVRAWKMGIKCTGFTFLSLSFSFCRLSSSIRSASFCWSGCSFTSASRRSCDAKPRVSAKPRALLLWERKKRGIHFFRPAFVTFSAFVRFSLSFRISSEFPCCICSISKSRLALASLSACSILRNRSSSSRSWVQ